MSSVLDWTSLTAHMNTDFWTKIVVLITCAGLIGFERQIAKKPYGIRTSILISMGAMLFVEYSHYILVTMDPVTADPTRVIGQVVTGIGFLGAGSIMNKEGLVSGLTTAATIWVQAAIGVIVAVGYYVDALLFSVITFLTLHYLPKIEARLKLLRRRRRAP